jgi:hypothetical protein
VERKPQRLKEVKGRLSCGAFRCAADPQYIGPILPRHIAKKQNLKYYFPGKLCKEGHFSIHLVSNSSCLLCHNRRVNAYKDANPSKIKNYQKKSRAKIEVKDNRNKRLQVRRDKDPIYRYVERIRNRIGRSLRKIKNKKISSYGLSKIFEKNIEKVLERQGLTINDIKDRNYELDHIRPLCEWEWSQSQTANKLISIESNSASNLQFISSKEHKKKTMIEMHAGNWHKNKIYLDSSSKLIKIIEKGEKLPTYLEPKREKIYKELKNHLKIKQLELEKEKLNIFQE